MSTPPRITDQEVRDALSRSGYLLEYRIEHILRRKGYLAHANQPYPDPITGKSRELDISAITAKHVGHDRFAFLWPVLLIECVNNPQPMAFFTKHPAAPMAHVYDFKFSGIPMRIKSDKHTWIRLGHFLNAGKHHHHCRGRIATQFCSFSRKKGRPQDWMAHHDQQHFDSFNALCSALNYHIDDHYSKATLTKRGEYFNVQMYYPILVVSGQIFDVWPTRKELKLTETNQIHYVQSLIAGGREQSYHIDVVTERAFPRLIRTIDKEIAAFVRRVSRNRAKVQSSIDAIAARGYRLRSPAAIRACLEVGSL